MPLKPHPTDLDKMVFVKRQYNLSTKREWVGLTDEEITEIRLKTFDAIATNQEIYKVIEAKLKDKNT
jgi:hypothetical protein